MQSDGQEVDAIQGRSIEVLATPQGEHIAEKQPSTTWGLFLFS